MQTFKDLIVWQKSRGLVKDVYQLTAQLPSDEKFGLISQARRSAVSIPSNIAEGHRRKNPKEYAQFLAIAAGSAAELETQLILMHDLFRSDINEEMKVLEEIHKMLSTLIGKIVKR